MTVREVLLLSSSLLDGIVPAESLEGSTVTGEAETLLNCFNVVENEIALDDYPLKRTEHFTFEKGLLSFLKFASPPVDVCAVRQGGTKIRFSLSPDGVVADCAEADVTYSYAPLKKRISDEVELGGKVSARLMAYGVVSEYCIVKGMTDAARAWGVKYREALRSAGILRRSLSVRSRRWV